jgi:hypothetical protein
MNSDIKVTHHWSRIPGKFVHKHTGDPVDPGNTPWFNTWPGSVREWYETLPEVIRDVSIELSGHPDCAICVPTESVSTARIIIESSILFKPSIDPVCVGELGDITIFEKADVPDDEIIVVPGPGEQGRVKVLDLNIV